MYLCSNCLVELSCELLSRLNLLANNNNLSEQSRQRPVVPPGGDARWDTTSTDGGWPLAPADLHNLSDFIFLLIQTAAQISHHQEESLLFIDPSLLWTCRSVGTGPTTAKGWLFAKTSRLEPSSRRVYAKFIHERRRGLSNVYYGVRKWMSKSRLCGRVAYYQIATDIWLRIDRM